MANLEKIIGKLQQEGPGGELAKSRYYKHISQIQEYMHNQIPLEEFFDSTRAAAPISFREDLYKGVNYQKAVIFLVSNGCEWALKSAHGCTMCGHIAKQERTGKPIPHEDYVYQFEDALKKIDFKTYPVLNLFNNGSFLNDNEIPRSARIQILKKINACPGIKMLVLETRPEFVTEDKIKEIKRFIPDKHVEVAMGLEIKNDLYRTVCLNKGFLLQHYDSAARIITRHLHLRTYVLLKPPFLTEKESIRQAVETVDHAFELGSTAISLEGCTIQDYTLVKYLYDRGLYRPPWLWSIVEVVKRSEKKGQLIIGLFKFYPSPGVVPYNCQDCSSTVMEAIVKYNRTLDKMVFDDLKCPCQKEWQKYLEEKELPFEKALEKAIKEYQLNKKGGIQNV